MKIVMVGCGALGSYYGARLANGGDETWFLLRSDYEAVKRDGVRVKSADGDFIARPRCAKDPKEIGAADLVVVGLKTTANDQFAPLITPLVGPGTAVLTLQNGLGNEELLARLFGKEKVLGGLCFVCINRLGPGVIQHVAHGRIVMGEFGRPAQPRTHAIAERFRQSGVPCDVTDNVARAHWEKLVWNVPFNGLGVAGTVGYESVMRGRVLPGVQRGPCLATDILLGDSKWEELVRELMREVIGGANALRLGVPPDAEEQQIARTRTMGAYRASTLIDFDHGLPLEIESIFLEPLRQASAAGVSTPRLAALCRVLRELDPARKAG